MTQRNRIFVALSILIAIAITFLLFLPSTLLILPSTEITPPPEACADWRWIGIKTVPSSPCPGEKNPADVGLPGWNISPFFPDDLADPQLGKYCLYEKPEGRVGTTEVGALEELTSSGLSKIRRDSVAVAPAASRISKATWGALNQHFRSQVGGSATSSATTNVRLTLLDTSPTGPDPHLAVPPQNRSQHGFTLANLARDLVCGDPASGCLARLHSRLAMPVVEFDPHSREPLHRDEVDGGFVGTLGDLALALSKEVSEWDPIIENERLILSLSLAWDPVHFGGLEQNVEDMYPAVQVVHEAIRKAACRGALVVVAAGNLLGDPRGSESGPLLPAAWEQRPAPGCLAKKNGSYRPLLYAVGAVDSAGEPLANARPKGMPRLVAYGDHAVTDGPGGVPTATLTGSSVSSLVASTAAAAVWHHKSSWSSFEVMDKVYAKGRSSSAKADFQLAAATKSGRRRVSPCDVLGTCSPNRSSKTPRLSPRLSSLTGNEVPLQKIGKAGTSSKRLPGLAFRPWVGPQPEADPCPTCDFLTTSTNGTLYLELAKGFLPTDLTRVTVEIWDARGHLQSYTLNPKSLKSPYTQITGFRAGEKVMLTIQVKDQVEASSQVLVVN